MWRVLKGIPRDLPKISQRDKTSGKLLGKLSGFPSALGPSSLSPHCATNMSVPSVKSKGDQEEVTSMDSDELQLVKNPATLRWPYLK